jgi:hypothetical protein
MLFKEYDIQHSEGEQIELLMPSKAIAFFTKDLVEAGLPPENIKTQTLLQQSYFSLSR